MAKREGEGELDLFLDLQKEETHHGKKHNDETRRREQRTKWIFN
jgi:hypothetical protein